MCGTDTRLEATRVCVARGEHYVVRLRVDDESTLTRDARWQIALESAGDALFDWDMIAQTWRFSPAWREQLGVDTAQTFWRELIHPDDIDAGARAFEDHLAGNVPVHSTEQRIRAKDGGWRWIVTRGRVLRDEQGQPVRFLGTMTDVTERRQLTEALAREKERLELATRISGLGVWEIDLADNTLRADARIHVLFDRAAVDAEPAGEMWLSRAHPADRARVEAAWNHAVETCGVLDVEFRIMLRDARVRTLHVLAQVMADEHGTPVRVVGVSSDVTAAREASETMRRAKEEAVAGQLAKSKFIASISHELRTPLNGIMVMTELMGESQLTESQREMVQLMRRSGNDLLVLIDDILDYSRFEAGRMRLAEAPFDVGDALEAVRQSLDVQARRKSLQLTLQSMVPSGTMALGDVQRLRQILTNLVGNAIKFTDTGSVLLWADARSEGEHTRLSIEVRDTGIGIPEEAQASLFQPFSQLDQRDQRRFGGSGLGLVISREIARAMGGEITVQSVPGRGSTFRAELSLSRAPEWMKSTPVVQPQPLPPGPPFRPLQLLMVEDNEANQRVGSLLLESLGHLVTMAKNGREALQWLAHTRFDCVLMDCQMPGLDGFETTRRIRRGEAVLDANVPIIALTASGMAGERTRCLDAGMNDYALKPMNRHEMAAAFRRCGLTLLRSPSTAPARFAAEAVAVLDPLYAEELRAIRTREGRELLQVLAELLLAEMPSHFAALTRHALQGPSNAPELARLAHQMAGSCAGIGATVLRGRLQLIEVAVARNPDDLQPIIERAADEWTRLREHLLMLAAT